MSSGINVPYFPNPTLQYDQRTMMQLVQAFALFARQVQSTTSAFGQGGGFVLQSDDFGLSVGTLFQQGGFVKVSQSNVPHPRGVSASAEVGVVTVVIT
jgi:hypothetical protein